MAVLEINDRQKQALVYLQQHPGITSTEYAKQFTSTQKTAQRDLSEMETLHIVLKEGKGRSTSYQLNNPFRTFPDISMRDPKNTIRLKIIIKTGKIDTDYRNLMIGNPDISGHYRTLQPNTCDPKKRVKFKGKSKPLTI